MPFPSMTVARQAFYALVAMFLLLTAPANAQDSDPERTLDPEGQIEHIEEQLKISREQSERLGEAVGEDPSGRHEWFYFQRRFPYNRIPAGLRADAVRRTTEIEDVLHQAAARSKGVELAAREVWENIGPHNIGGRVRAIAVDPDNPSTIHIGAASGGVWKNEGDPNVWTTTFDKQSALAISAIEYHPDNHDIIYVGTGEVINSHVSQFNSTPAYLGDGVFRSTDRGQTWEHFALAQLGTISTIYVRRDNPDVMYVTSAQGGGGFYKSTDGGETFVRKQQGTFFRISVNPLNEDHLVVSARSTIYRSTDGGETFEQAEYSAPSGIRTEIALAPSDPSKGFALVAKYGDDPQDDKNIAEVHATVDSGKTWHLIRTFSGTFFNNQGHYNNCIAIHPNDPDIVLVGGIDAFKTANGGQTWSNTTRAYTGGDVHPDQHVFAFNPNDPNEVFLGNDGGVYRSTNAGSSWTEIGMNLPITQFYEIGVDQTRDFRVYGGTQDNNSLAAIGSVRWPDEWDVILGGDGFHAVVDKSDSRYVYAESQYGRLYRIRGDNPSNRDYLTRRMDNHNSSDFDPGAWSTPVAMSPADEVSLYTGRQFLWRSFDLGQTWEKLDPDHFDDGTGRNRISAIGLSWIDNEDIVIGTASGQISFSRDGGATWMAGDTGNVVPVAYVSEVYFDPVEKNRVYVTVSSSSGSHVFRSDNYGESFTDITANLPEVPHSSIAVDPENTQHLFVANDVGVFVTLDGGQVWLPFNEGFPTVPVVDLEIHRDKRTLFAATHGRSVWEISIDDPQPVPIVLTPSGGQSFESGDTIRVSWAGFTEPVRVMVSYNGGESYDTILTNASVSTVDIVAPFLRSTNTIIRIENMTGEIVAVSNPVAVRPRVNTDSRGGRGFVAGAVEVRDGELWAVDRDNNDIVILRLPTLLPTGKKIEPSGLGGSEVVDLAYDSDLDMFYVLMGDSETFAGSTLHSMNPDGTVENEIPLPHSSISGVAVSPAGLTVISPGLSGKAWVIDRNDGTVVSETTPLEGGTGEHRVGLIWDGVGLGQGVDEATSGTAITDAFQRMEFTSSLVVRLDLPLVVEDSKSIDLYGLAWYSYEGEGQNRVAKYYLTDTEGEFYILDAPAVSGVVDLDYREFSSLVAISDVNPNPFRDRSELSIEVGAPGQLLVELLDQNGRIVSTLYDRRAETGSVSIDLDARTLASGVYYVIATRVEGGRDVRSVVVLH